MSGFKKNIKDLYQENNETYSDAHWNNYVAYEKARDKKSKRRFLWLFFVGGLVVTSSCVLFYFYKFSNKKTTAIIENIVEDNFNPSFEIEKETRVNNVLSIGNNSLNNTTKLSDENHFYKKGTILNSSKSNTKSSIPNQYPTFLKEKKKKENMDYLKINTSKTNIEQAVLQNEKDSITELEPIDNPIKELEFSDKTIKIEQDLNDKSTKQALVITAGLAYAHHTNTSEEIAHQVDMEYRYALRDKWRFKSQLSIANINFVASEMTPKLGISEMAKPSPTALFERVVVESISLNTSVGVDYVFYKNKAWQFYTGLAFGISAEVFKDEDYEFSGLEIDYFISQKNNQLYFQPAILDLELGLEYFKGRNGIQFNINHPIQLNENQVDIFKQTRFNIGLVRLF